LYSKGNATENTTSLFVGLYSLISMNISPKGNFANEVRDIIVEKSINKKQYNTSMTFDYVKTAFKALDDGPG